VQENVAKGAVVRTDGWIGYDDLATLGYVHEPLALEGDPERTEAHLPMIHIAFSNLKTWLLGTHHGVSTHQSVSKATRRSVITSFYLSICPLSVGQIVAR
jgi:hypothetical protein